MNLCSDCKYANVGFEKSPCAKCYNRDRFAPVKKPVKKLNVLLVRTAAAMCFAWGCFHFVYLIMQITDFEIYRFIGTATVMLALFGLGSTLALKTMGGTSCKKD